MSVVNIGEYFPPYLQAPIARVRTLVCVRGGKHSPRLTTFTNGYEHNRQNNRLPATSEANFVWCKLTTRVQSHGRQKKDVASGRGRSSKINYRKKLPKMLPGAVCEQWVRCGKANCRCARGERHGPYFFRFWREDGRLRKEYIKRRDVERVRAECEARRSEQRLANEAWDEFKLLTAVLRELERQ